MAAPGQKLRDIDTIRQQLIQWLPSKVINGSEFNVTNIRGTEANGFANETILASLSWKCDGDEHSREVVLRLPPVEERLLMEYNLKLQFDIMNALEPTAVPVPKMLWYEFDESVFGTEFFVMECIEGWTPADIPPMHLEGKVAEEMSPAEREAFWWSGLEAMASIHKLDVKKIGLESLGKRWPGETLLDASLDYYEKALDWGLGDRSRHPILLAALDWLRRNKPSDEPVGLCWGDARAGNQIFQGTDCVAVLDWELACLGNPIQDLGWWLMMDKVLSEGIGVPRLDGFPSHEETAKRWSELTGQPLDNLRYYEIFALFRDAIITSRSILLNSGRDDPAGYENLSLPGKEDVSNLLTETLAKRLIIAGV